MRMTKTGRDRLRLGALVALGLVLVTGVGYMAVTQVPFIASQVTSRKVVAVVPPPTAEVQQPSVVAPAQPPAVVEVPQPPVIVPVPVTPPAIEPSKAQPAAVAPPPKKVVPKQKPQPPPQQVKVATPAKAVPSHIQLVQSVQAPMGPDRTVGCDVGTKIPTYRTDQFRIELLSVRENSRALQVLNGEIMGNTVMNLYEEVKAGTVPRLDRDGTLTITVDGVNASAVPDRIWYATGSDVCAGFVPVRRTTRGFAVNVPIRAGEHRGQTSIVLPRDLLSGKWSVLVCVKADYDIYAPELTAGYYRGQKNTICGLPGSNPGTTRISEMVLLGKAGVMFGLVKLN